MITDSECVSNEVLSASGNQYPLCLCFLTSEPFQPKLKKKEGHFFVIRSF